MEIRFSEKIAKRVEFTLNAPVVSSENTKAWGDFLYPFLKLFTHNRVLCLVDMYPMKDSFLNEYGKPEKREHRGLKYQVIWVTFIEDSQLRELLVESDFYLGHVVISLIEKGKYEEVNELVLHLKGKELSSKHTAAEYIFMEGDGKFFCWNNPSVATEFLRQQFDEQIAATPSVSHV